MEIILYLSVALVAIAFLFLVIFLIKTLKSLQLTLDSVSKALGGLENQLDGVTKETTALLKKTNTLADDLQKKSDSLTSVVDAVKDVGTTIQKFNQSVQSVTNSVHQQMEQNQDKISQIIQWGNVLIELKDKWKTKKQKKAVEELELPIKRRQLGDQ
jgi:uncharacterized protein YoxC